MAYLSKTKIVKRGLFLLLCSTITFFIFTAIPTTLQLPLKLNLSLEPSELTPSLLQDHTFNLTILQPKLSPPSPQQDQTHNLQAKRSLQRQRTHLILSNKYFCRRTHSDRNKTAIIWVNSAREHFLQRNLIRQTWGAVKSYNNVTILGVVFMLGSSDRNGEQITDVAKLNAETVEFGDIVIGDFVDSYRNLSRKAIMAVEWITTYCPEAQLVIKTDDDVVLNIFRLTEELNALSPIDSTSPNFRCRLDVNEKTITNLGSQFYVAPGTFKNDIFPDHCQGLGWVAPMNVIVRIAEEIKRSFVGWVLTHEDVFITSIVPAKVNEKSSENERIQYIDKARYWFSTDLNHFRGKDYIFLRTALEQGPSKVNYSEFRSRVGDRIFYLLAHTEQFPQAFMRLWRITVESAKWFEMNSNSDFRL